MKKTSGGTPLRRATAPNITYQDGEKRQMLCGDCENILQIDEALFAKLIFRPIVAGSRQAIRYDLFLARFLVSLLWRNLAVLLDSDETPQEYRTNLEAAEERWRLFLLKRGDLGAYGRIHLFVTGIASPGSPPHNVYLTRAIDATIAISSNRCAVYLKFAHFLVWAEITDTFDASEWINTRISIGPGTLEHAKAEIRNAGFAEFLIERGRMSKELLEMMSTRQKEKRAKRFEQNAGAILRSELGVALTADKRVAEMPVPKVGRNDRCPCWSGKKYKKCHGATP